jgi:hypothetical protein
VGLQRLRLVLEFAVEWTCTAVHIEELLRAEFGFISAEVLSEHEKKKRVVGKGDVLVEVPSGMRLGVCEPQEVKGGRIQSHN